MRRDQDRAARRLVHTARFHADETVLHQIEAADTVGAAQFVQRGEQRSGRQRLAVNRNRIAAFETDLHHRRLVGRILRIDGALIDDAFRLHRRIFQNLSFRRGVQKVRIHRERRVAALVLCDRYLMRFGEFDQLCAAGQIPFAPRCDDLDVGLQRVIAQLETDLVVAFAGCAMRHGIRADFLRDLDLLLGDQGPRDGGAQQIDAFIERVGAEHGEDVIADEFLAHILDEDVAGLDAQHLGLLARRLDLAALAQIGSERHHLRAIFRLQPFQDDRRIQPARIGEHHFLDLRRHGNAPISLCLLVSRATGFVRWPIAA